MTVADNARPFSSVPPLLSREVHTGCAITYTQEYPLCTSQRCLGRVPRKNR